MRQTLLICLGLCSLVAAPLASQQQRAGDLSFEAYSFKTFDQQEHPADLGKLWVPENRAKGGGRMIQLTIVRLKSTAPNPQPPIVFLAGGPGVPGTIMGRVPVYFALFERLRGIADVILLDQRGTGLSSPNLQCPPPSAAAPPDLWETRAKAVHALGELVRACADHWRAQGVEPGAYNTAASAEDLEDLRRGLGVERLSLLGHSYGTTLALAAVRRHGDRLHRVVLAAVQGPDQGLKLPFTAEFGLRKLALLAAEDPAVQHEVPDLIVSLKQALARLEGQPAAIPFTEPATGKAGILRAGKFALQLLVDLQIKDGRKVPLLPALVWTAGRGDYSLLAPLLTGLHTSLRNPSLMQFPMTCSDGASAWRRAEAAEQAAQTLLGNPTDLALDPELCAAVANPSLGLESRSPIWSPVTALFLSGSLDSGTPPSNAEEVRWGFPHSMHIIVENGFHETLPAREVQDVVVDFFSGQDVLGRRVALEPPRFLSPEQARAQIFAPSRPR